jgi:hypothetical protein
MLDFGFMVTGVCCHPSNISPDYTRPEDYSLDGNGLTNFTKMRLFYKGWTCTLLSKRVLTEKTNSTVDKSA